jgi:hypothetical protein
MKMRRKKKNNNPLIFEGTQRHHYQEEVGGGVNYKFSGREAAKPFVRIAASMWVPFVKPY